MLHTALRGYDRRAVDQFLARCVRSLGERAGQLPELAAVPASTSGPALDARDVREALFPVVLGGYQMAQVDALLERVAGLLPGDDARPGWCGPALDPVALALVVAPLDLPVTLRGYDRAEVEEFLARCAHSLGDRVRQVPELAGLLCRPRTGPVLRPRDVEMVQFRVRTRGYDIEQVDALLDRVMTELGG